MAVRNSVASAYLSGKRPYSRVWAEMELKLLGKDPLMDVHLWDPVAVHRSSR